MRTSLARLLLPLGFCLFSAIPVAATTFFERPFQDTVKDAPVIARGKVGAGVADFAEGDDKVQRIYTYYDLNVAEVVKGDLKTGPARIRSIGGEKDGVGMQVSGAAQFTPGEEVVVFLGPRNADGSHDIHGLMMGKYEVVRDAQGADHLEGPGLGLKQGQADSRGKSKWTLDDLRKVVSEQAGAKETPGVSAAASPTVSPLAAAAPSPTGAPALQPSPVEESTTPSDASAPGIPFGFKLLLGCALGVAGFLLARGLKSRNRS